MDSLSINHKICRHFLKQNFSEITPVPIFTSNTFVNPNILSIIKNKNDKNNYIAFSHNLNLKMIPFIKSKAKLFSPHLAGILFSKHHLVMEFVQEFYNHMVGYSEFYWEARETTITNKVLGLLIYGWNLYVDGTPIGYCGYINKLANKQVEGRAIFDLNLEQLYKIHAVKQINFMEEDFPEYLMHHSSKRVLFELFDNYLNEFIFCASRGLNSSALIFLTNCYSVYELLIIRGFISKTEKIGYDTKMNTLFRKCIESKVEV